MRLVRRRWGWYFTIINSRKFKVKLLRFSRHEECSYQFHYKRNELWLFLKGKGGMIIDGEYLEPVKGDWYAIYEGVRHQFRAWKTTYVLEIQFGEECKEEDIVRIHENI